MVNPKRNVGREILEGLRELKRGEHGRVRRSQSNDPMSSFRYTTISDWGCPVSVDGLGLGFQAAVNIILLS